MRSHKVPTGKASELAKVAGRSSHCYKVDPPATDSAADEDAQGQEEDEGPAPPPPQHEEGPEVHEDGTTSIVVTQASPGE